MNGCPACRYIPSSREQQPGLSQQERELEARSRAVQAHPYLDAVGVAVHQAVTENA